MQAAGQVLVNTGLDILAMPLSRASMQWLMLGGRVALRRLAVAAAWNGIMVVCLTTWAMSFAQQAFAASTAALAYAMEPVFAAMFAAVHKRPARLLALHPRASLVAATRAQVGLGEFLTAPQMFGGALVVGANIVAAVGGGVWVVSLCFPHAAEKIAPVSDEDDG